MRSTIICVDDEKLILNMLYQQLQSWFGKHYQIEKASNATDALKILDDYLNIGEDVSVFISDYIMPITKGDELLTMVKERTPKTKRIMLTGYSAIDGIVNAINKAGIYRYISKPWDNKDLMLTLLEAIKAYEQEKVTYKLSKNYETLYYKYEKLYNERESDLKELLKAFSVASDIRTDRDFDRGERISEYCSLMADALKFSEKELKGLRALAFLCDIGKTAMSDDDLKILKEDKPGNGTYENAIMRQAQLSEEILKHMKSSPEIAENIKYQFETYDGSGPFSMKGEEIPLYSRILHIVRLYDEFERESDGAPFDEIIAGFVAKGNTHLDTRLTSLFVKALKKRKKG